MGIEEDIKFGWLCRIIQKLTAQIDCVDGILKVLWTIGLIGLFGLPLYMLSSENPATFLGAYVILIAALTASFSVMKSIKHSELMAEEKRLNEIHKHQEYVLQLLFNLQELLTNLNRSLHSLSQREPLPHTVEDIDQQIKRYKKILGYIESEGTLLHLDSEEISTIFDLIEGSEKWLKSVNMFLEKLAIHLNPDDIDGYESYYLHLEHLISEAKRLFARELA